ncbi:MAG TPA: hypothetical protein VFM25_07165, partial [Verrucomicrobiae bacterium]|nr:hypothetical protein [Verrucomicrobiae bacterium]
MKNKLIMTLGAAMLIGSIVAVQAVPNPINGSISFSDDFTANGALNVATAITSLSNVKVSGTEGDYSGIATGTAVDFSAVTALNP